MRWPWVSRARLDDANRGHEATIAFWRQCYNDERKRHDALADKYHALKLAGGAVAEPPLQRVEPKPPDLVTQAMIAKAKGSRILLKQFSEFIAEQRSLGLSEPEIAQAILDGVDDDAGVPG